LATGDHQGHRGAPAATSKEENLSREEELRRERARQRELG
jgi:hypothetical protein